MTVKYRNKRTGEVVEGLLVTGDSNDTVGIVVWAGSLGAGLNQVSVPAIDGGSTYILPVLPGGSFEEPFPVGSLVTITGTKKAPIVKVIQPALLAEEFFEEVPS